MISSRIRNGSESDIRTGHPKPTPTNRTDGRTHEAGTCGCLSGNGSRRTRTYEKFTRTRPSTTTAPTRPTRRQWVLIWAIALAATTASIILTTAGAAR